MIKINLEKEDIKNATLICGFQGMWLIGPIVIQYLLEHMKFENIGDIWFDALFPISVVHEGKVTKPLNVFYNREKNIVLLQCIMPSIGIEWQLVEAVEDIAKKAQAKEIICVDGVETEQKKAEVFYATNCNNEKKIEEAGAVKLDNALLYGVTSAFLIKESCPLFCVYGKVKHMVTETEPRAIFHISDSKTAADVISFLNKYLDIEVDVKDLIEKSGKIEEEIKKLIKQMRVKPEPKPSYFG